MKASIVAALTATIMILATACGEPEADPFDITPEQQIEHELAQHATREASQPTPTLEPTIPGDGPAPPERPSFATRPTTPTPTVRVRPTFFPTRAAETPRTQTWDEEQVALAYAHCNNTYHGAEREYRYNTAIEAMGRHRDEHIRLSNIIEEHCQGDFTTSPDIPTPTPPPPENPDSPLAIDYKVRYEYMLDLINQRREEVGAPPLELSLVTAAQKHADQNRLTCSNGYWSTDGKNLALRYSEYGGRQPFAFAIFGQWYCDPDPDYSRTITWKQAMEQTVLHLEEHGPHHYLDPSYKTISIGHSPYHGQQWHVLIFEQEHVRMKNRPILTVSRTIAVKGTLLEPAASEEEQSMFLRILHAPMTDDLSRWQIALTPHDEPGVLAGEVVIIPHHEATPTPYLRTVVRRAGFPLPHDLGRQRPESAAGTPVPQPDDPDGPTTLEEAQGLVRTREIYRQHLEGANVEVPVIRAKHGSIAANGDFSISANIHPILESKGPGIYTVIVFGTIEGETTELSRTSIVISPRHPALVNRP